MEYLPSEQGKKNNCCSFARTVFELFKATYRIDPGIKKEYEKLMVTMSTKTWVCHSMMTFSRVLYPLFGIALWQKGKRNADTLEGVNREFICAHWNFIFATIIAFIATGIVLDVVAWKQRWLCRYFIYYECFGMCLYFITPLDRGDFSEMLVIVFLVQFMIQYGCDLAHDAIVATITSAIVLFVINPLIY